jgi:hypothetical protein
MGRGAEILYIKDSLVKWKDIHLWQPEFGPEEKHFVSGNFAGFSLYISWEGSVSEAAMGGPRSSFRARRSSVGGGCSVAQ